MKKIICPTDFTSTANNAIEYAAKLAQKIGAEIELIHVQLLYVTESVSTLRISKNVIAQTEHLQKIANEVTKTYGIKCSSKVELSDDEFEQTIVDNSDDNNLIVIGSNGADDIFEFIFGTNSYHLVKKAKCPVLIIPEGFQFKEIKKMVFAWDYSDKNKLAFLQVKDFIDFFEPEITFLHVGQNSIPNNGDVFESLKQEMLSYLGEIQNISFARVYLDDPETYSERMDSYVTNTNSDLLAVTFYDRGFIRNLFHGNIVKGLTEITSYPLLVLHM